MCCFLTKKPDWIRFHESADELLGEYFMTFLAKKEEKSNEFLGRPESRNVRAKEDGLRSSGQGCG